MKRLVLHAGGRHTGWATVQRQLVRSRSQLRASSVLVPATDDPAGWHRLARAALGRGDDADLESLLGAAGPEDTVLLSSDEAGELLHDPAAVAALCSLAARHGGEAVVVLLLRDQLDQVNRAYCRAVLDMRTAASFEEFATEVVAERRFDPARRYAAVLAHPDVALAAVPSSAVDPVRPAAAVLAAAGVPVPDDLPSGGRTEPAPGPTVVAATRLLHKRLWRHGAFQRHDRKDLISLARRLRRHAEEKPWDSTEFWGWSPTLRGQLAGDVVAADHAFAQEVWGTPWPEATAPRRAQTVTLTTAEPALVADVLDTLQDLVVETVSTGATHHGSDRPPVRRGLRSAGRRLLAAAQRLARSGK